MIEKGPGVIPLHADFPHGRDIENRAIVTYRMVFGLSIAIVMWQDEFIPADVMFFLYRLSNEVLKVRFVASIEEIEKQAFTERADDTDN